MSEYGQVIVTRHRDEAMNRDVLHIDRADPRALISPELLDEIREGAGPWAVLDGDVLTLSDDYGQRFIYRIGRSVIPPDSLWPAYEMEWPD